jgi:hypothetical protein
MVRRSTQSAVPCVAGIMALALACLVPVSSRAADPAIGVVVFSQGGAEIHRIGGSLPAVEGCVLMPGDTVIVAAAGECRGFEPSGERFNLRGPAQLLLSSPADQGMLDGIGTWIRRQIAQWIGETRRQPLTMRSARDWEVQFVVPAPLLPAANARVRPGSIRLVWAGLPGADRYTVTLAPANGAETQRTCRGSATVVEDLTPGEEYVWKVRPAIEGWPGDGPWSAFRVMTREEEQQLDQALQGLGDLEAGVLLLSAGLPAEAVERLDAVAGAGEETRAARRWRARALYELGLYREACQDLMQTGGQD